MSGQLRDTASKLAEVLWREHTVYRDRAGGVVIRGEHVQRWISLAPAGGRGEILVRAGRILDGGTTAPARSEAIVPLDAGTAELAAACRRMLAEAAAEASPGPNGFARSGGSGSRFRRSKRTGRRATSQRRPRHIGIASWLVLACVIAFYVYSLYRPGAR
ncbi:hypothetical protein [Streptomyces hypolithicus]